MQSTKETRNRWAIILAGGEGRRLSDLSCRIAGEKTPKQYCQIVGDESLIEQTRHRVELTIRKDQILYALSRSHERHYISLLTGVLPANLVIQPMNRGTAPAVLYSLMRIGLIDPNAYVALFPCDHYVSDNNLFMRHVGSAFEALVERPELIVLLGIAPNAPETEYGWIEPTSAFRSGAETLFHVRRLIEKPSVEIARRMWAEGRYLWNSFVLIGRLWNLLALMIRTLPELCDAFAQSSWTLGTAFESEAVKQIYQAIAPAEFCGSVLTSYARDHVSVLPVSGLYWNDLGNPARVFATMKHLGLRPQWIGYAH